MAMKTHSPEELETYITQTLAELDTLIADMEKAAKTAKGTEKAWFDGALNGLRVARAALTPWKHG